MRDILGALNAYASARRYTCECPRCKCPAAGGEGNYTFRYINLPLVYYDVPKCASTSIRRAFFGADESMSLRGLRPFSGPRFRFSFVRNPWSRAVSNWRMFTTKKGRRKQLRSMGGSPDMEFLDFLKFAQQHKNHHWLVQSLYVPKRLDFLGRLENFGTDFEVVSQVARGAGLVQEAVPAPQHNSTESRHYSEYYSDPEKQMVETMYGVDIERFGYRFED